MTFADFYWNNDVYALPDLEDVLPASAGLFYVDGQPSAMNVSGATDDGSFQLDGQGNRFEIHVGLDSEVGQFSFGGKRPDFEGSLIV